MKVYVISEGKKNIIQEFYKKLYNDNDSFTEKKALQCLEKVILPKVPEEIKGVLNEEIKVPELIEAIKKKRIIKHRAPTGYQQKYTKNYKTL